MKIKPHKSMRLVVLPDFRTVVPSAFTASGEPLDDRPDVTLNLSIRVDHLGRPRCTDFRLHSKDGAYIESETLRRLPLARLVREATQVASSFAVHRGTTPAGISTLSIATPEEARKAVETVKGTSHRRTRTKITPDFLQRVAECHERAEAEGSQAPTRTVAEEIGGDWNKSFHSAKRWVQLARKSGHLPPATRGRPAA